jgi:hypothetical protein
VTPFRQRSLRQHNSTIRQTTGDADVISRHADRLVDKFSDDPPEIPAADLDTYDDEAFETALAIAAERRGRAAAGVKKWPGPKSSS